VMSANRLAGGTENLLAHPTADGTILDLHSGGEDNIFPHHECEIAQSCCAFGIEPGAGRFARHWFHARFLLVEGSKMSKSKGNFYTIRDLLDKGHEHAAIRLELIKTHYRSNANFTEQGLKDSARMVERWRRFASSTGGDTARSAVPRERARVELADALHDDLNIAGAIAAVNTLVSAVAEPGAEDVAIMREFDSVLGVLELDRAAATVSDIGVFAGVEPSPEVSAKLEERRAARAAKDFKKSDAIRDELAKMGYAIKDVAGGKVEVRRA